MTDPAYNADDRIHLWVNLALMGGASALAAGAAWSAIPLPTAWRAGGAFLAFLSGWVLSNWLVPRMTGRAIERKFGKRRKGSPGDE